MYFIKDNSGDITKEQADEFIAELNKIFNSEIRVYNSLTGEEIMEDTNMKINTKDIAEKIQSRGLNSSTRHIEDVIYEMIINSINPSIDALTEQVLEHLQELEHPEPRNREEYDERIGADKDE